LACATAPLRPANPARAPEVERLGAEQEATADKPWERGALLSHGLGNIEDDKKGAVMADLIHLRQNVFGAISAMCGQSGEARMTDRFDDATCSVCRENFSNIADVLSARPSDLDTFRAMLERAHIPFKDIPGISVNVVLVAGTGFDFHVKGGKLLAVGPPEKEPTDG